MDSSPSDLSVEVCFRNVRPSFLQFELSRLTQCLMRHWDIATLTSFMDRACQAVVRTSTCLGCMDSAPSDLSAKVRFRAVRPSVLQLKLSRITQWLMRHWDILLPSFIDPACLSVICTPTNLGSMDSSPSDLFVKFSFRSVRPSVLQFELSHITQWLIRLGIYCSLASCTLLVCPSYAHPHIWALWTLLHQVCLLSFFFFWSVHLSVLQLELSRITQWLMRYWDILLPSFMDPACLSVVCTPTTLSSMDFSPSDLSAEFCFRSVCPLVLQLELSHITQCSIRTYCSLASWTLLVRPLYAHPQIQALWTPLHQICLLSFFFFWSVNLSVLQLELSRMTQWLMKHWDILLPSFMDPACLSVVCTPTNLGSSPSNLSADFCFSSVRPWFSSKKFAA